jgi:predicted enzyme related to lactoylglutathione lyase
MTDRGLVGAVLYAKDLQRLVDFYSAVVGVEVQKSEQGFAILGSKPSQLVIVRIPQHLADIIDITTPPVPREGTPMKLVFAVDDIASARLRAAERGAVVNAIEHEWDFEGARVSDGYDPEGNVFQLRCLR